jgi:hypothetical protein
MSTSSAVVTDGLSRLGWSVRDLWVAAIGIGGSLSRGDIEAIAAGTRIANRAEHNILVAALNDGFTDLGQNHPLAYWPDIDDSDL